MSASAVAHAFRKSLHAPGSSIDDVLAQLDEIIATSIQNCSRLGFFAALYRQVTYQVKVGIAAGQFEDGSRMERLDVCFAQRYFTALKAYMEGGQPSLCWRFAFESADSNLLILQQLLLGMNAHINLDLGIAAAETCPGCELQSLQKDFYEINRILATLLAVVQRDLDELSPWIGLLDTIGARTNAAVMNFNIQCARDFAWNFAQRCAASSDLNDTIRQADEKTFALAQLIRRPIGVLINAGMHIIRAREQSDVAQIIHVLSNAPSLSSPMAAD